MLYLLSYCLHFLNDDDDDSVLRYNLGANIRALALHFDDSTFDWKLVGIEKSARGEINMRPTGKSLRVEEIKRGKSQSYQSFAFLTN